MGTTSDAVAQIGRLLAGYALYYDSGDLARCTDLFTEDCGFEVSGQPPIEGRRDLLAYFERAVSRGAVGIHLPGPTLIDVDDDETTATMWQSFMFVANGSNNVVRGMYRDEAVLTTDGWHFTRRSIELFPGAE